ncbi:MAG: hypothetical protein XD78_1886 [Desulfotomaculum sp. 46_296]|nr:MAG: hypothetical protein XD78_1886 [Desulfotomaculum sp. 46_296]HAU30726.1 hypothetical protein [Desulfotomaculum sp.]
MDKNMETLLQMNSNAVDKVWDIWLATVGSFSWGQEYIEKFAKDYIERRKVTRDESVKIVEGLMEQARKNHNEFRNIVQEAVKTTFSSIKAPYFFKFNELSKKIDDLSEKVQNATN